MVVHAPQFCTAYWVQGQWAMLPPLLAIDGYYMAYNPIPLPCILFIFMEMKFIRYTLITNILTYLLNTPIPEIFKKSIKLFGKNMTI